MRIIIVSSLILSLAGFFGLGSQSIAEEVVLCVSTAGQYVVTVNEKGDCLEDENQIVISGTDMARKKSMIPVAKFTSNDDCDGQGMRTEIGFDENGNGEPDANEIVSTTGTCAPHTQAQESEELADSGDSY